MIQTYEKDPGEVLDYGFDLQRWLTPPEQVVSGNVVVTPANAGLVAGPFTTDGTQLYTTISGGTLKQKYVLTFTAVTNSVPARVFVRSITIFIIGR